MTILADADGELVCLDARVIELGIPATLLDDMAIAALDRERREWRPTCPGCHQELVLKRYPRRDDWWLFAHKPGEAANCHGADAGESAAHHELKLRVAELGKRSGWEPAIEVWGDGCRADVLLTKGDKKKSWEIQLSGLATPDALDRTDRLTSSFNHPPVWLHQTDPTWARMVPSLGLNQERTHVVAGVYEDMRAESLKPAMPLGRVVPNVLHEDLLYTYREGTDGDGGFGFFFPKGATKRGHSPPNRRKKSDEPGGQVVCPSVDVDELRADDPEPEVVVADPRPVIPIGAFPARVKLPDDDSCQVIHCAQVFMHKRRGDTLTREDIRQAEQMTGLRLKVVR